QRAQFVGVVAHQFQQDPGIRQVIASPRGGEGRAIASAGERIDRIDFQPRILQEGMNDGAVGRFQPQAYGTCSGPLAQALEPLVEVFGRVCEATFLVVPVTILPSKTVLFVTPIQANPQVGWLGGWSGWLRRRIGICRVHHGHVRLSVLVNVGRRLYSVRRRPSAPENAYPRSGYGSGREIALSSSSEQTSCSYRSRTQNVHSARPWGAGISFVLLCDGVVDRLTAGAGVKAPAQPVNNAGQAI